MNSSTIGPSHQGGSEPFNIQKQVKEWKNAKVEVRLLEVRKDSGIAKKLNVLVLNLISSNRFKMEEGGKTQYLYFNSKDGQDYINQYKKDLQISVDTKRAIEVLKSPIDETNIEDRKAAAKYLAPDQFGEKAYEKAGIIVRLKTDKNGNEKIEIFHLIRAQSIGKGAFTKVMGVAEEVFYINLEKKEDHKLKSAVMRQPLENSGELDDLLSLKFIKEINGGVMPEGIQKGPKVVSEDKKMALTKFYPKGDLYKALLEPKNVLKAMKGPFQALCTFKKFGIAHGDIKPENILVEQNGTKVTGVVADFGKVLVLPDFPDDPEKAKNLAVDIIKLGFVDRDGLPDFIATQTTYIKREYDELTSLLNTVWNQIKDITYDNEIDVDKFKNNYKDLKLKLEKFQVMQMGMALGSALLGEEFDTLLLDDNDDIGDAPLFPEYQKLIIQSIATIFPGDKALSDDVSNLLLSMIDSDSSKRIGSEEAMNKLNAILEKINLTNI